MRREVTGPHGLGAGQGMHVRNEKILPFQEQRLESQSAAHRRGEQRARVEPASRECTRINPRQVVDQEQDRS